MKKTFASLAIAGLAVTAFAACGDDDGGDDSPDGTDAPAGEITDVPTDDTSVMTVPGT